MISIHKRTLKYELNEMDYEYKIRPNVYWGIWKKTQSLSIIEEATPKDNIKISLRNKIDKEIDALSVWNQWKSCRLHVTLIISRCKAFTSKYKKKFEKFTEIDYNGPFTLFGKLRNFHRNDLSKNNMGSPRLSPQSTKFRGLLHEINSSKFHYKLLQLDLKQLFWEYNDLYWNLVYRFIKDKKDYIFMLPYEVDIEDIEENSSSLNSESVGDSPERWLDIPANKINLFSKDTNHNIKEKTTKLILDLNFGSQTTRRTSEKF